MAKPAGPIGNSPRDMRDDAVGVPADDIKAPEPPRWPPKPKRVTSNTFHAKVSGGSSAARADRKPHFRRGGFVKGYAAGGPVESKNDPGDLGEKGLKSGGVAKRAAGGKLSAAQRQSLPKSDFALPGAGKGPKGAGSGSYPINDPSHARNALARSSGKPEEATVRAKVKAKYPDIG